MTRTAPPDETKIQSPPALGKALAWLATLPPDDLLRDLTPLGNHLDAIAAADIAPIQYFKILELFQTRAALASSAAKPLLLDATLPVSKRLRVVAHGLMRVHGALAAGYLKVIAAVAPDQLMAIDRPPAQLRAHGLANLMQQYEVAQFISASPPPEFWEQAHGFYSQIVVDAPPDTANDAAAAAAILHMKGLLAMAAAQPEGLSPREAAFLVAYLRSCGTAVIIGTEENPLGNDTYWLDKSQGFLPTAAARRSTRQDENVLRFSCSALGRIAAQHVAYLATGAQPEILGLPHEVAFDDYRHVLTRAAERWTEPPRRQAQRRRQGFRVQICTHLGPLWRQMRHGAVATEGDAALVVSDWMILNQSPSGYAIMHIAGTLFGLFAGAAVGLRASADQPWSICVVRWARSENPEHIELGLELLAPRADAVRLARHVADAQTEAVPALLLPPLPALRRGESLLTARGYFMPGAFTLIDESSANLRVADIMAKQLALHTASIEVFEFERCLKAT